MDKWCEYHKDRDHDTEGYRQLRYMITYMIREGKIKEYLVSKTGQ